MSLVKADLVNAIKTAIQDEVSRCTVNGQFKPTERGFDNTVYLDAIYKYIKDNAVITVLYSGVNTQTGVPDPLNGNHDLKAAAVSNESLKQAVSDSIKAEVARCTDPEGNFHSEMFSKQPWWIALVASLLLVSESTDNQITLQNPAMPVAVSTKVWVDDDFKLDPNTWMSTLDDIWGVYAEEILTALSSAVFAGECATTSTSGGAGISTFISIA